MSSKCLFRSWIPISFSLVFAGAALLFMLGSCGNKEPDGGQLLPRKVTILPESESTITLSPCSRNGPRDVTSTWMPKSDDVVLAESRLKDYLTTRVGRPLDSYYRQYIGITIKGKRVLYINGFEPFQEEMVFEQEMPKWRTEYISYCDGGDRAWGVEYYVDEQKLMNFETNGP